jgi:membrane peptidoglycan carboxypeptidase
MGEYIRGASTITQQLAKNLYLSPRKTLWRKMRETLIAKRLESALGKNRIFHLYLNIIEFGSGIFGVQEAARYYFNKDIDHLNLEEIIRLTAIIPKPLKEDPRKNSKWLLWKCRWIINKLKLYEYISEDQYNLTIKRFE